MAMSEFDRKHGNGSFCAWAVQIWPKRAPNDWCDVGLPSSCNASQLPRFLVLRNIPNLSQT